MRLDVVLVSKDQDLIEFCREILGDLFGTEWALKTGAPGRIDAAPSLCIWDFVPGEAIPQDLEPRKNWFIAHREDLAGLQQLVNRSDLNVLLKPVTRAALEAFFLGAAENCKEQNNDLADHISVLRDERDEMLQFLIQANLKLQEHEQERNNFLARSVHDFRAPLTAISGYCDLLAEEALGAVTQEQREVLGRMQRSVARLSRISEAMFHLTVPYGTGKAKVNLETADIRDCLDQALHEVSLMIEDKGISLAVDIQSPADPLLFGKAQMEQVLVNLLDNACKFTPRNGSIEIKGYPFICDRKIEHPHPINQARDHRGKQANVPDSFRVDIRDSGPGIPAVHVKDIFQEYTSYAGGHDRSGGGLGLAICRMILDWHGGHIWAESSPSGGVFSFILPLHLDEDPRSCGAEGLVLETAVGTMEQN